MIGWLLISKCLTRLIDRLRERRTDPNPHLEKVETPTSSPFDVQLPPSEASCVRGRLRVNTRHLLTQSKQQLLRLYDRFKE
jgi:hypothetical protein